MIRWPFVWRSEAEVWERSSHAWAGQVELLTRLLDEARAEQRDLVARILELKREGFMPPVRPEMLEPSQPELPEAVMLAIGQRALPKSDLERELLRWGAAEMRREGADPEAIARMILRGGGSDFDDQE